jgi:hypothetical protein
MESQIYISGLAFGPEASGIGVCVCVCIYIYASFSRPLTENNETQPQSPATKSFSLKFLL